MCFRTPFQIFRARDKRKDKTVDTPNKLRLLYKEGRKVAAPAHVADFV